MSAYGEWEWQSIKKQAETFCFYAREFEGADYAQADQVQIEGLDVRRAGNVAAKRAKAECEKLQRQLALYHNFISEVIKNGGL